MQLLVKFSVWYFDYALCVHSSEMKCQPKDRQRTTKFAMKYSKLLPFHSCRKCRERARLYPWCIYASLALMRMQLFDAYVCVIGKLCSTFYWFLSCSEYNASLYVGTTYILACFSENKGTVYNASICSLVWKSFLINYNHAIKNLTTIDIIHIPLNWFVFMKCINCM